MDDYYRSLNENIITMDGMEYIDTRGPDDLAMQMLADLQLQNWKLLNGYIDYEEDSYHDNNEQG